MSKFQTFFLKFSERLAPSVWGVGVHKGTMSYPISRDKAVRVNDVRLYLRIYHPTSDFHNTQAGKNSMNIFGYN